MSSLPAPLRDFVVGFCIVGIVLAVVRLLDPGGGGTGTWVLLPVGAGLFVMRQGVRRMVLRQVEARSAPDGTEPAEPGEPGKPGEPGPAPMRTPTAATSRSWQEDPLRVVGVGLLVVVALAALAFL